MLPVEIAHRHGRPPALDQPEQPFRGFPFRDCNLGLLEMEHRHPLVRLVERVLQLAGQCVGAIERVLQLAGQRIGAVERALEIGRHGDHPVSPRPCSTA